MALLSRRGPISNTDRKLYARHNRPPIRKLTHHARPRVAQNALHWVRVVVYDEDRSQIRTGNGPRVMASLRILALSTLRIAGHQNIAAALRHHHALSNRPATLLLTS